MIPSFLIGLTLLSAAILLCIIVGAIIDVVVRAHGGGKDWLGNTPLFLVGATFIFIIVLVVYISIQIGDVVLGHAS